MKKSQKISPRQHTKKYNLGKVDSNWAPLLRGRSLSKGTQVGQPVSNKHESLLLK